ncbi:MAG TPA: isoprenylcysteine carboxylmethyltransferase family protein [Casimicrobiaceae bacterium]|nr:isoprenylcysteine carboxylmethyltransferase family protein [Casimicrobiaceae bacterium]
MQDMPLAALTATLLCYWIGVGVMIVRVRRALRRKRGSDGEQRFERFNLNWIVWVALVAAWIGIPWATLAHSAKVAELPAFATSEPAYRALRWIAALVAVAALAATIRCWKRMGSDWRMDVGVATRAPLITDGFFAYLRHPIYAFSILLMLCSVAIVPTPPMLAVAAIHFAMMNAKARSEERHLLAVHGDAYARYLRTSGRFLPRRRPPQG